MLLDSAVQVMAYLLFEDGVCALLQVIQAHGAACSTATATLLLLPLKFVLEAAALLSAHHTGIRMFSELLHYKYCSWCLRRCNMLAQGWLQVTGDGERDGRHLLQKKDQLHESLENVSWSLLWARPLLRRVSSGDIQSCDV